MVSCKHTLLTYLKNLIPKCNLEISPITRDLTLLLERLKDNFAVDNDDFDERDEINFNKGCITVKLRGDIANDAGKLYAKIVTTISDRETLIDFYEGYLGKLPVALYLSGLHARKDAEIKDTLKEITTEIVPLLITGTLKKKVISRIFKEVSEVTNNKNLIGEFEHESYTVDSQNLYLIIIFCLNGGY
jgi:hypothetical protein